jgi:creatinine amidohydrolase
MSHAAPQPLPSRYWSELTTQDFATLPMQDVVAVLPVAAIEQHGPHLPLAVDALLLQGVIDRAMVHLPADAQVLFLPAQQIGRSIEHEGFAGTLSLSVQTLFASWLEIGAAVARAGVRKLLIFNSHGGQVSLIELAARELRARHGLLTYYGSWFSLGLPDGLINAHEERFGVHGGEVETSMMLALAPHLVRMELAQHFGSTSEARSRDYPLLGNGAARFGWQTQDLNPSGAVGNAAAATAAKGQAILDHAGRQLATLLQEMERLPLSTLVEPSLPR